MKYWAFLGFALASAALIGCGGGGDNGGGGGGGGGGTVAPSVNTSLFFSGPIPKPGLIDFTYDTGQGRGRGAGMEPTATLKRVVLEDLAFGPNHPNNVIRTTLNPARVLGLAAYSSQSVGVNAPMDGFSAALNNRKFNIFNLEIEEVSFNGVTYLGLANQALVHESFPFSCTAISGRTTSATIFLNDAMFEEDGFGGLNFLRDEFELQNLNPDTLEIMSHLADYLAFDISNVPYAPNMTSGTPATTFYFSGDALGLSATPEVSDTEFEVLVPESPDPGSVLGICNLGPSFPVGASNTYTIKTLDPRNLQNNSYITSLQGTWKWWLNTDNPAQSPILNPGDFVFITFPQSSDSSTQDCAIIGLSGGVIVDLYFGEVNLSTNSFDAWPVSEVIKGTTNGEINGTLGSYVFRTGIGVPGVRDIRSGNCAFTNGDIPKSFPSTGSFIVYRL